MDRSEISVYVHVPFCSSKCHYCDFYSVATGGGRGASAKVIDETLRQLERFRSCVGGVSTVQTVYVGGGTPSALDLSLLRRLLGQLSGFHPVEWTVEANPESLDTSFLETCRKAGVSRLSVGLQSMDDRLLRLVGRPGNREHNLRAIDLLGKGWSGEVNFDLLAGIPGQTLSGLLSDIDAVLGTGCGHVSLYALTVEPGTPLERLARQGVITLNPPELDEELWLQGAARLREAGLRWYEVSNFARPGRESLHNMRYWRLQPYIGAGPAAVSTLPAALAWRFLGRAAGAGGSPVVRLSNPRDLGSFLAGAADSWGMEVEEISAASLLLETLMMGLRLEDGVEASLLRLRFGRQAGEYLRELWAEWVSRGLAMDEAERFRLTEAGRLALDRLLSQLAERLRQGPPRGLAVRWP